MKVILDFAAVAISIVALMVAGFQWTNVQSERDTAYRSAVFDKNVTEVRRIVVTSFDMCTKYACDAEKEKAKRDKCTKEFVPSFRSLGEAENALKLVGTERVLTKTAELIGYLVISEVNARAPLSYDQSKASFDACRDKVNAFVDFVRTEIGLHQLTSDLKDRWRQRQQPSEAGGEKP